jgi:hypothetical protein
MQTKIELNPTGNELLIREGKAAEVFNPEIVSIDGNIEAPATFVNNRKADIPANKTNVIVDYDSLTITLVVDEESHYKKTVKGSLVKSDIIKELGINAKKSYSVSELVSALKLKRAYFKSREAHAGILKQLQEFTARTEVQFTSLNDYKGNVALSKIASCKTNLDYQFSISLPIYKAIPANTFDVDIEFEPKDGSIICWLISPDLAELEITLRDELMNKQLDSFTNYVVIKK